MNTIFLDIDGVLNSERYFVENQKWIKNTEIPYNIRHLDSKAVMRLAMLVEAIDANIVISSTWRLRNSILEIRGYFQAVYDEFPVDRIIGKTGKNQSGFRGDEIQEYIDAYFKEDRTYLIIDDDSDFYDYQPHLKILWKEGLTSEDCWSAITYFFDNKL